MKNLPESDIYESSLAYWPYKSSLEKVISFVCKESPQKGKLLDIMCGPGYLLGKIAENRKDLVLTGVDIDDRYINYGRSVYNNIRFEKGDVLEFQPDSLFDVVLCTGSIHHVSYDQQEKALSNISSMVKQGGLVIISDCYIDDYGNEQDRKISAANLGNEYLKETIRNQAPESVIKWTMDILWNDVLMHEFKTSLHKRLPILKKYFREVNTIKTWPKHESGYGDYIHICRL